MCGAEPVETSSGIQAGKGFAPRAKCWGRLAIRRRESAAWFNQAPIDGGVFIPPPPPPHSLVDRQDASLRSYLGLDPLIATIATAGKGGGGGGGGGGVTG